MLGRHLLFTIGDNDAIRDSEVRAYSPNKLYVFLSSDHPLREHIGWVRVADIRVLDTFPVGE